MCIADDVDGWCVVLHERHPTAKKEHKCTECCRVIRIGEEYMVERTVYDGSAQTIKTCAHCQVARGWLMRECGGFVYTAVEEDIQEHAGGAYGFGLVRLYAGMALQWCRKDGRLWQVPKMPSTSGHAG